MRYSTTAAIALVVLAALAAEAAAAESSGSRLADSLRWALTPEVASVVASCAAVGPVTLLLPSQNSEGRVPQLLISLRDCGFEPKLPGSSGFQSNESAAGSGAVTIATGGNPNTTDSAAFRFAGNDKDSESSGSPITFKQSVVFAACGAVIAAFFLVAAVMRFRNRLKKKIRKRRQAEKELESLRKKNFECRMTAAAASRAPAPDPVFIVDYASLENVEELDAESGTSHWESHASLAQSDLTQAISAAAAATAEAAITPDSRSGATLASPECSLASEPNSPTRPPIAAARPAAPPALAASSTTAAAATTAALGFRRRPSLRKSFSYQSGVAAQLLQQQQHHQLQSLLQATLVDQNCQPQQQQLQQPLPSRRLYQQQLQRHQLLLQLQQHRRLLEEASDLERHFQDRRAQNSQLHRLRRASSATAGRAAAAAASASASAPAPAAAIAAAAAGRRMSIGGVGWAPSSRLLPLPPPPTGAATVVVTSAMASTGIPRYKRSHSLAPTVGGTGAFMTATGW